MTDRTAPPSARVAVLIDADNASAKHAVGVFEEVTLFGEANVRRIYGDFSSSRLTQWTEKLQSLAILPQQQFNYTTGKNAADITLVIDAMDLMHGGLIDTFCLVSSDSDFTRLAQRLREHGKTVIGFGERKTPEAFRNACSRFLYFDNLGDAPEATDIAPASVEKMPPSKACPLILKAMAQLEDDEGWVMLGPLGQKLVAIAPDFDQKTYGCAKLSELVKKAGSFEIDQSAGKAIRIRHRPAARKTKKK